MINRVVISVLAIAAASLPSNAKKPFLIWNVDSSVPIGLYIVEDAEEVNITDLVAVRPPAAIAEFLADREYARLGAPLLERVLALPGQTVCRNGSTIMVDGIDMGATQRADAFDRPLPDWQGCRKLTDDMIFVMNWHSPHSVDSRYFGPLPRSSIVGRATPLWAEEQAQDE